ncbi:MAG: hypothetical protein IPJ94_26670 [Chloroflexi bacterium]|nr:hypothetical protein [Chloroflexota bacterium]
MIVPAARKRGASTAYPPGGRLRLAVTAPSAGRRPFPHHRYRAVCQPPPTAVVRLYSLPGQSWAKVTSSVVYPA